MIKGLKPSIVQSKEYIHIDYFHRKTIFFVTKEEIKYLDRIKLIHKQNRGSFIRPMNHLKENLQQKSDDSYENIVPNKSGARFLLHLTVVDVLGNKYPKEEITNDRMIMDCGIFGRDVR